MKNIYLIPTDKPSRLFLGNNGNFVFGMIKTSIQSKNDSFTNQNIYITSDEEIKEGDWCYYLNNLGGGNILCQAYKHSEDKRMLFDNGTYNREIGEGITPLIGECKKIILTTDQELIKDGVQAIDDEFLEWFIKNPSCEEVEVEWVKTPDGIFYHQDNVPYGCYKIIIPKEEPKQETFEEIAEEELKKQSWDTTITLPFNGGFIEGFQQGANWQAERMYSDEEVESIWKFALYSAEQHDKFGAKNKSDFIKEDVKEFIKQFKKK